MFKIPGKTTQVRLFDRVETVDEQYNIYDVGFQYEDGGIDSVVVGGSFYTLKKLAKQADKDAGIEAKAETPAPVVQGVVKHPVTNYDGAEQDIEGL